MAIPTFENRIYLSSSPQAQYLRSLYADIGKEALQFAVRTHKKALENIIGKTLEATDARGFVMGLHLKAIDVLTGIRCLGANSCIGPAIALVRTLFETYVALRHVTERDTTQRVALYRDEQLRQLSRMWTDLEARGDPESARHREWFDKALEENVDLAERLRRKPRHWSGLTMEQLAGGLGLGNIYATLYRSASRYTHALDIDDTYNPIFLEVFDRDSPPAEPHFIVNLSCWSAMDVLALVTFSEVVGWSHFGTVASFLDLSMTAKERDRVATADYAVRHNQPMNNFAQIMEQYGSWLR